MISESEKLIGVLLKLTNENLNVAENFKTKSLEILNWKQDSEKWSVLECLEHLNRYGDFYIPEITSRLKSAKHKNTGDAKSSMLGGYFSNSVSYKEKLNKMKTFSSMNPKNSRLDKETITKFVSQQQQIIELLERAKIVSLTKTKTSISISKFIKLRLGDSFRVLIFHNERHMKQAEKTLVLATSNSKKS